jgi:hypothetical protein
MRLPNLFKKSNTLPIPPVNCIDGYHPITGSLTDGTTTLVTDYYNSLQDNTINYHAQYNTKFLKATKKLLAKIGLKKDELSDGYDLELSIKARFTEADFGGRSLREMEEVVQASIEQLKDELLQKLTAKQTLTKICADALEHEESEIIETPQEQMTQSTTIAGSAGGAGGAGESYYAGSSTYRSYDNRNINTLTLPF